MRFSWRLRRFLKASTLSVIGVVAAAADGDLNATIKVMTPDGGETLHYGAASRVVWTAKRSEGGFDVLIKECAGTSCAPAYLARNQNTPTGADFEFSYAWDGKSILPGGSFRTLTTGKSYWIAVVPTGKSIGTEPWDESDHPFILSASAPDSSAGGEFQAGVASIGSKTASLPVVPSFVLGREVETVFDYSASKCERRDFPDSPAHAFRDADGQINLLSTTFVNRRMKGSSLDSLKRDCSVVFGSAEDPDFADFKYREWLTSFYTLDGQTTYALVHNEWYAYLAEPERCPAPDRHHGWVSSITLAVSTDKGATYAHPVDYHILGPATEWETGRFPCSVGNGTRYGMYNPTNIVKKDDHYYALFGSAGYSSNPAITTTYPSGTCLMRTKNLALASSWEVWTKTGWDDSVNAMCQPIENLFNGMHLSLTYNNYLDAYIVVGNKQKSFSFSLSKDLYTWTKPVEIMSKHPPDSVKLNYPSLIDPTDTSRNFEYTGRNPYLYYTRINKNNDRDLVRRRITFTLP